MILVTGGTGFIGSHLLDRLSQSAASVRCLVRRRPTAKPLPPGIETSPGDLASGEGIAAALTGVDTVIHLAGVTKALRPDDYYAGNARATENLARLVAGRGIRFVHVSSLAAVGPSGDGTPVDEDAPPHPLTDYGKSKRAAEEIVRRHLPGATIVRPPVVYGPRDTDVFQVLRSIANGLVLEIAGGERWFSAIFVHDLVDGLLAAAQSPAAEGRTYFLAHPDPLSWTALRQAAARVMGRNPRVLRVPGAVAAAVGYAAELWARAVRKPGILSRDKIREAHARWWICDTRRAARDFDFHARTPLDRGMALTLEWYREARWLRY